MIHYQRLPRVPRRARLNKSVLSAYARPLDMAYDTLFIQTNKTPDMEIVEKALYAELRDIPGSKYADPTASGSRSNAYLEGLLKAALDAITVGSKRPQVCDTSPRLLVGLPNPSVNDQFARALAQVHAEQDMKGDAPRLFSANALWRKKTVKDAEGKKHKVSRFHAPEALWLVDREVQSLDSAGFTAMVKFGGYRWRTDQYVWFMAQLGLHDMGFPFNWWSAMDYCCEEEIAKDREEVLRRIDRTVESYGECLREWLYLVVDEGFPAFPEPMPILQGRTPQDYINCYHGLVKARRRLFDEFRAKNLIYYEDGEVSDGVRHLAYLEFPQLLGVGSVCRRNVLGAEGILPILQTLDAQLPKYMQFHLFGVKGSVLNRIGPYTARIASIDSMAYAKKTRERALARSRASGVVGVDKKGRKIYKEKPKKLPGEAAADLKDWVRKQMPRLIALGVVQRPLSPAGRNNPRRPRTPRLPR